MTEIRIGNEKFGIFPDDLRELADIYAEHQKEMIPIDPFCSACGHCCHFEEWGHRLYLTHLELFHLIQTTGYRKPEKPGFCPYQGTDGRCEAREGRPLGCRVFFCTLSLEDNEERYDRYLAQIVAMAKKRGISPYFGELWETLVDVEIVP